MAYQIREAKRHGIKIKLLNQPTLTRRYVRLRQLASGNSQVMLEAGGLPGFDASLRQPTG
jgi:hypothetical protein